MSQIIYYDNGGVVPPGTAVVELTPDSGTSPVVPTAGGNINVLGGKNLAEGVINTTTVGSLNTLTVNLKDDIQLTNSAAGTTGATLTFDKNRAAAIVAINDLLGEVYFAGFDGTINITGALISAKVTNTVGANRIPTSLEFWTHSNAVTVPPTLRMILNENGTLTINDPDSGLGLHVLGGGITLASENIDFPETTASTSGVISQNGTRLIHTYKDPLDGEENLFIGQNAGNFTCAGATNDSRNTGIGVESLISLTSGIFNTFVGHQSGQDVTSGSQNVGVGLGAMGESAGVTGRRNVGIGVQALAKLTSGNENTTIGNDTGYNLTTGSYNVIVGNSNNDNASGSLKGPLFQLTTGSYNIAIGASTTAGGTGAGYNYTTSESSNIVLGGATTGTVGESNTMRLGTTGAGNGQVNRAFIAGTYGITPAGAAIRTVVMDSSGQMGTSSATGLVTWNVNTTTPISLAVNNGYVANVAGLLTYTLPAAAAVGDIIEVTNFNTAVGWRIAQNASQLIRLGTSVTTTGVGGYLEATALGDSVKLVCIVANTTFQVLSVIGNITVV